MPSNRTDHIRLTSHPEPGGKTRFPIRWGAATARQRGPVIGTVSQPQHRNVIGSHGGSYALYRALAVSAGALDPFRARRAKIHERCNHERRPFGRRSGRLVQRFEVRILPYPVFTHTRYQGVLPLSQVNSA